ncbi:MAG: response regulator [Asticcacaulis sp.]|uniref:response regulator n=1 Tax=Asticcacaulis sp. TaxID=1872648 RepID=UPI0039E62868
MTPPLTRILCVDDERDILDVAQMCLERIGHYQVTTCESGSEALIQAEALKPDLILLDVMMPEMNGPDTFAALRKRASIRDIPVIFMTARIQSAEIRAYLKQGIAGVIAKPFDAMALSTEVQKAWEAFHAEQA